MLLAAISIASVLAGIGTWAALHRYRMRTSIDSTSAAGHSSRPQRSETLAPTPQASGVELANSLVTERLWKLAFAAPSQAQFLEPSDAQIRDAVSAVLEAASPDPNYFPRRPTLMPQLMRAVNDPAAGPEKLSRMIAHDPVFHRMYCGSPILRSIELLQRRSKPYSAQSSFSASMHCEA